MMGKQGKLEFICRADKLKSRVVDVILHYVPETATV